MVKKKNKGRREKKDEKDGVDSGCDFDIVYIYMYMIGERRTDCFCMLYIVCIISFRSSL